MQDILSDEFWLQNFSYKETINQTCQKLQSLSHNQVKNLKAKYENNPFLFLRCNSKILDELKKIGIDIVVDHNDQNKIFTINENYLLKIYDEIFNQSNNYFDYVVGDGYCQTRAAMRAFGYKPEEINENTAYQLRVECSNSIDNDYDSDKKDLLIKKKWVASGPVVSYLSKKNKRPAWNISLNRFRNSETLFFSTYCGATFEDILYNCPVVVLNGGTYNHAINLTTDRAKRKKFVLEFFDLFAKAYTAYVFWGYNFSFYVYDPKGLIVDGCNYGSVEVNSKNNFYELIIPSLLSCLFKKIDKQEIITQLENFFNGVRHDCKNMVATKLILYVFDKYKTKILKPFDINMPENKFPTANKFLSDLLVDLKKDLNRPKKKIFGGLKVVYIFLCIVTFGIFYFVYDPPGKNQDEPLIEKNYTSKITTEKNNTQDKQKENDKKMIISEQEFNPKTQPLLINLNNESKKINRDQPEH